MWDIFKSGAEKTGVSGDATDRAAGSVGDPIVIIGRIINTLLYIVGFAGVVAIIIGGIMYATSAGDEKRAAAAKKTIIGALIGLGIVVLSWFLANFVLGVLGSSSAV